MSLDALCRLEEAHNELIAALDRDDIDAVEQGLETLREAVHEVRAEGAWHDTPELRARARRIVILGEAARIRVNFLTDSARQRLHMLTAARGRYSGGAYGRRARMPGTI